MNKLTITNEYIGDVLYRKAAKERDEAQAELQQLKAAFEDLQRANQNTLADLAVAIQRRDEAFAEIKKIRKERDEARAEVQRVRKLWNESHIAERDDFAKEEERLKAELSEAIRERNKTVADLINQRDQAIASARQEPSRLEIAAMLLAALAGRESDSWEAKLEVIWAIEQADELIAAAKEAK